MGKFLARIKKSHASYGEIIQALIPASFEYAVALAVFSVESAGEPLGPYSRPIIRFEVHKFWDIYGKWMPSKFDLHFQFSKEKRWEGHKYRKFLSDAFSILHTTGAESQQKEWEAFYVASGIDNGTVDAAITSTSFGMGQIMGFHWERLGYKSPGSMLAAQFQVASQIQDFLKFIRTDPKLLAAVEQKDWATFARIYNGSGQVPVYSAWLKEAYTDALTVANNA